MLPASLDDLTPSWLEGVLRERGVIEPAAEVEEIRFERTGEGIGIMADLARARIGYRKGAGQAPASVIVKVPARAYANREVCFALGFYEREVRFYQEVAPDLSLRVPQVFASEIDVAAQRFAIVMEDLEGFTQLDQLSGISPDRARLAIEALALLHAAWWDAPGLDDLGWMPRMNDSVTLSYGEYYRASWPAFVENFGGALDPAQIAAGEAGGRHQEALLHALAGSHSTICHMDYKLDNLLFGDPRVAQAPLVVIDWQVPVRGRGACDVAYLLSQSMTVADRRESETTLLRLWHDRLRALGVEGYGFDQAELDYRRAVLRGLAVPVEMGGALDLGNERAVELVRTIVDRSFTAAVDCAATEGLL